MSVPARSQSPLSAPLRFLTRAISAVRLPEEVTDFERSYLARMNRMALVFFQAHVPLLTLLAWLNGANPLAAALMAAAVAAIPTVAMRTVRAERTRSLFFGFTAMCMGGVLVHVVQGPVQIEMHFYFFSLLAMLALFANPMVVVVAAATVAVHHLALWYLAPKSVFNYDAPLWVVLVHAAFVVLETPAACFIARNFFDNVIGLEHKVQARTAELDERNVAMRMVLDNVRQGLVVVEIDGALASERSEALAKWFGPIEPGDTLATYFGRVDARFGSWLELSWESVTDGFLPTDVALDQLPRRLSHGDKEYAFEFEPVLDAEGQLLRVLLVASDVSAEVAAQEASRQNREAMALFQRVLSDRAGLEGFMTEAKRLLSLVRESLPDEPAAAKRPLHTLKGNAGLFGLDSLATRCHNLEDCLEGGNTTDLEHGLQLIEARWAEVTDLVDDLVAKGGGKGAVVLGRDDYDRLFELVVDAAPHEDIARELTRATLEPASTRLEEIAHQARAFALRLERGDIEVETLDNDVRLERDRFAEFWMSFAHVVRNAIDHGLESPEERAARGKPSAGRIEVRTFEDADAIVVELTDDGRGIDWDAVAERARALGVHQGEREALTEALFSAGLTTRSEVTETSGRGVGLAAVKEACDALGGTINVTSESGSHTTFQFRFPTAVAVAPTTRLRDKVA